MTAEDFAVALLLGALLAVAAALLAEGVRQLRDESIDAPIVAALAVYVTTVLGFVIWSVLS